MLQINKKSKSVYIPTFSSATFCLISSRTCISSVCASSSFDLFSVSLSRHLAALSVASLALASALLSLNVSKAISFSEAAVFYNTKENECMFPSTCKASCLYQNSQNIETWLTERMQLDTCWEKFVNFLWQKFHIVSGRMFEEGLMRTHSCQ